MSSFLLETLQFWVSGWTSCLHKGARSTKNPRSHASSRQNVNFVLRLKWSEPLAKCADRKNSLSTSSSVTCLAHRTRLWHRATTRSLPPLLRSIDISAAQGSLPLFFAPPSICRPKVPRRRLLRSCVVSCFSLSNFLSQKPLYQGLPKDTSPWGITWLLPPWGMQAPCALCQKIGCIFSSVHDGEK